ncbi:MAG: ABC transporter ATP-binding protein [Chloroflexota bacterium]|nr:ABC transporter ATP-binding protein [Chloroflexota bacterium]
MSIVLEVSNLAKSFKDKKIFEGISFDLRENEIISILGPSGCGKTTLLNSISGIDDDFAGKITTNTSSVRRIDNFSYSQQKDLLIPWKNVLDNAVFGLEISGTKKDESYPRALSLMSDFKLEGIGNKFPHQLSGGMRQRVSLIRSFLLERPILLLDEPFGSLDSITREDLQDWLLDILKKFRMSSIFVTHDINEAIKISDRIIVMSSNPGKIVKEIKIATINDEEKLSLYREIKDSLEVLDG